MDFILAAITAAFINIGFLGGIIVMYVQSFRLIKSYFTKGLVIMASLFLVQNIVLVAIWSYIYTVEPVILGIVDAAAPYLFTVNVAQTGGLAVLFWITRK